MLKTTSDIILCRLELKTASDMILGRLERLEVKVDTLVSKVATLVGERERKRGVRMVELSAEQRMVLLDSGLTDRVKAERLGMSVGWVSKWKRRLATSSVGG